jgi:hypothetical protein
MRTLHNLVNRSFLFALFFTSLAVNSLVSQQELGTQLSSITILASANNDKLLLEPVAVATSNTPVCEGDTIFFTGDGAQMGFHQWNKIHLLLMHNPVMPEFIN